VLLGGGREKAPDAVGLPICGCQDFEHTADGV
jgi:hypothetical protein